MKAYRDWIIGQALPFWSSDGFDHERGRFRERLDMAGRPLDVPHRLMLQARQIYVFSHAAVLGWFPEGAALAETAMASLLRTYRASSGGRTSFAFSADSRGGIVSEARDAYAHAFLLFALGSLYRMNGDRRLLEIADDVIAFLEQELADPVYGGLFDSHPVADRAKRQNPLMHLLEAYLLLERVAPGGGYLARAADIVALFERHLFRADPGILLEYFAEDWSSPADPARAAVFEPGHHFEWVWLLHQFADLAGERVRPAAAMLYATASDFGMSPAGLIWDELDAGLAVTGRAHRVWPHTEAIKAGVVRHLAGDAQAEALTGRMAVTLRDTFLDRPFAGGWIDHVGADGSSLSDFVPASSLYHLFLAGVEAERLRTPARAFAPAAAA